MAALTKTARFPGESGLSGTLGYTIFNSDGSVASARTTAGIAALTGFTDIYVASITPPGASDYALVWDDGSGHYVLDDLDGVTATGGGGSDPWATALPGTYSAGEAGYILGSMATTGADASTAATQATAAATFAEGITTDLQSGNYSGGSGGSGFTGPDAVTIQFNAANNAAVPYVPFVVVGVGAATTNAEGQITVGLNPGTYTVIGVPTNGVLFSASQFTVSGTTSVTVTGTAAPSPSPAANPSYCVPWLQLAPGWSGSEVGTLTIQALPQNVGGLFLKSQTFNASINSSTGVITFPEVPQGASVHIAVPGIGLSATYVVPESSLYQMT